MICKLHHMMHVGILGPRAHFLCIYWA